MKAQAVERGVGGDLFRRQSAVVQADRADADVGAEVAEERIAIRPGRGMTVNAPIGGGVVDTVEQDGGLADAQRRRNGLQRLRARTGTEIVQL